MTQRRTAESMRDAGVTAEGVALIMPLIEMLDDKWPTRERFMQQATEHRPGLQLTKQRLSKELGSKYKPMGPEWEIAELIVALCADEAERPAATARIAGLYCAARGVTRIPGYDGPIELPHADEMTRQLADTQADLAAKNAEAAGLRQHVEQLEAENAKLSRKIRQDSARQAGLQQELRGTLQTLNTQQDLLADANARLRDQSVRAEAAEKRLENLRERYSLLAAHTEMQVFPFDRMPWPAPTTAMQRSGLALAGDIDPAAPPTWRALALYLHTHQAHSERHLDDVARVTGLTLTQLTLILTARELPSLEDAERIALAVSASAGTVRRLHNAATTNEAVLDDTLEDAFQAIVAHSIFEPSPTAGPAEASTGDAQSQEWTGDTVLPSPALTMETPISLATVDPLTVLAPSAVIGSAPPDRPGDALVPAAAPAVAVRRTAPVLGTVHRSSSYMRARRRRRLVTRTTLMLAAAMAAADVSALAMLLASRAAPPGQVAVLILGAIVAGWTAAVSGNTLREATRHPHPGYRGRHLHGARSRASAAIGVAPLEPAALKSASPELELTTEPTQLALTAAPPVPVSPAVTPVSPATTDEAEDSHLTVAIGSGWGTSQTG
jgi:hypothetical protein